MIRRPPTIARRGMVVAAHPLAAEAGVEMLRAGGHAVDAALAAAMVLAVVEPSASGLGGDAFLLIYDRKDGAVSVINGSGRAPGELRADRFASRREVPARSPLAPTVPGCVSAWDEASYGWGRLEWRDLLAPATALAEEGYPVSWRMARILRRERATLAADPGLAAAFLDPTGAPRPAGSIVRVPALARTLRTLADDGPESFYHGPLAGRLARGIREAGGMLSVGDLAAHESDLRSPVTTPAHPTAPGAPAAVELCTMPLPSQGMLLLLAAAILERCGAADGWLELARQAQAVRTAFVVRDLLLGDPSFLPVPEEDLLAALFAPETITALARQVRAGSDAAVEPAGAGGPAEDGQPAARRPAEDGPPAARRPPEGGRSAARRSTADGGPAARRPAADGGPATRRPAATGRTATARSAEVLAAIASAGAGQSAVIAAYRRAGLLDPDYAGREGTDTTFLCAADGEGNAVCLIQSVFHPFGCGFLDPSTGVIWNNRGAGFSLDPRSVNRLEPGKRARHTLHAWMVTTEAGPWLAGGTPGAQNQVAVNLQILRTMLAGRELWPGPEPMLPGKWTQARRPAAQREPLAEAEALPRALEAPRWDFDPLGRLRHESRLPGETRRRLRRAGWESVRGGPWDGAGFAQAIRFLDGGVLLGATDPRGEGLALGL